MVSNESFELILKTESKVLSTNIDNFKTQVEFYLSNLTSSFETDDDFAKAEEEVKELKNLEDKTRAAIKSVMEDGGAVSDLLKTAEEIAERFRQERLDREKKVKARKDGIKQELIDGALLKINQSIYSSIDERSISEALNKIYPKSNVAVRIADCTKNKRTIDSLTKAINSETNIIISELSSELARLKQRLQAIPNTHLHLFSDAVSLIASDVDIQAVVSERIEEEEKRIAEREAVKTQVEQPEIPKVEPVQHHPAEKTQPVPQSMTEEETGEVFDFVLKIPFRGTVEQARKHFAPIKQLNYENIQLVKLN